MTFGYFGLTYEVIEGRENEVALYSGPDKGKIIIPQQVEHDGKTYVVTQVGSENNRMPLKVTKTEGVRDNRRKDGWKEKPRYVVNSWEIRGPFNGEYVLEQVCDGTATNPAYSYITDVVMPNTITKFTYGVFRRCKNLKSIELPHQITAIPDRAFSGCEALEKIDLHEGVLSIGKFAFAGCTALREITIPSSVKTIDYRAFIDTIQSKCGIEVVNICNKEGDVIIHPEAFTSRVKINYLGVNNKKRVSVESMSKETQIDLDKLIDAVVADGVITDKERSVILKKAKSAGYDLDEVEILLDGKLAEKQNAVKVLTKEPKKAPAKKEVATKIVTPEEKSAEGGRNYSKYAVNGAGSYGKGRMVEAVVNKYVELNPGTTVQKLKEVFPEHLQGSNFIKDSSEKITDMKRYYESALPGGAKFYISNQWGVQTDGFVAYVNENIDGITVTKL